MKKPKLPSIAFVKEALYADWSLRVKIRDGFRCLLCPSEDNLTAHHWYACDHHAHAARYSVDNGATLCYACHIRGIHPRADWVSVKAVRDRVGLSEERERSIDALIETEVTTELLRTLFAAMQKRVIKTPDASQFYRKGKKAFLATAPSEHQIAVAGNVVSVPSVGKFEVTAVSKVPYVPDEFAGHLDGANAMVYRYSLREALENE